MIFIYSARFYPSADPRKPVSRINKRFGDRHLGRNRVVARSNCIIPAFSLAVGAVNPDTYFLLPELKNRAAALRC